MSQTCAMTDLTKTQAWITTLGYAGAKDFQVPHWSASNKHVRVLPICPRSGRSTLGEQEPRTLKRLCSFGKHS